MTLTEALSTLDGKAELTADDAIALRRIIYGEDEQVTTADAEALFKLNADAGSLSAEWCALFVEAMVDYVVRQETPTGYVDDAKSDWLIAQVSRNNRLPADEVEMLVRVLEQADQTPAKFEAFVHAVLKSLILWKLENQKRLAGDDVQRLRRVLFAAGGESNIAVSRTEAELLFDINDALKDAVVDPAWTELFVQAIGNSLLFAPTWTPDAPAEVKREAWLEDTHIHPLKRLEGLAGVQATAENMREGLREVLHDDFINHDLEPAEARDEALEIAAERLTAEEARWLVERIDRDGQFDLNEQALVAFVRQTARFIDPSFETLIGGLKPMPPAARPSTAPQPEAAGRPVFGQRKVAPQPG